MQLQKDIKPNRNDTTNTCRTAIAPGDRDSAVVVQNIKFI